MTQDAEPADAAPSPERAPSLVRRAVRKLARYMLKPEAVGAPAEAVSFDPNEAFERACREVDATLFEGDDMRMNGHPRADEIYFYGGRSALRCVLEGLALARAPSPRRILDYPSGAGRALRYLRAAFPSAEIFAGDLQSGHVDFCVERFGAKRVAASVDLAAAEIPGALDVVWCGSLATHISADRSAQLLHRFADALAPGGVAFVTFHGRMYPRAIVDIDRNVVAQPDLDSIVRECARTGYGYRPYRTPEFERQGYGVSLTSPGWVFERLHERDDVTILFYREKGWHEHQDVVAILKRPLTSWYDVLAE